ncbi:MAG TPA: hypothetical protein VFX30_01430 [bacterium]|nr:hypothetical protein [bacterium]
MLTQITRIPMIPAVATSVGREWAQGRLDTFTRLSDHLAEISRAVPSSGALRIVVDGDALKATLLRQSRATERGSSRKLEPPYNDGERQFFGHVEAVSEKALEQLRQGKNSSVCTDGWALLNGAAVLFREETGVPQFFGLGALSVLRKVALRQKGSEETKIFFDENVDDRLGAGIVTALRIYLGMDKLGGGREDLVPHRFRREAHAWVIGSLGTDPR